VSSGPADAPLLLSGLGSVALGSWEGEVDSALGSFVASDGVHEFSVPWLVSGAAGLSGADELLAAGEEDSAAELVCPAERSLKSSLLESLGVLVSPVLDDANCAPDHTVGGSAAAWLAGTGGVPGVGEDLVSSLFDDVGGTTVGSISFTSIKR
jgi:hypothetical protein